MKKKGPFEWTEEADKAFQDLKKYLTSPPVMVAPRPLEPLLLYLAAAPYSASVALVAVREERQDKGRADAAPGQSGAAKPSAASHLAQQSNIAEAPEGGQASGDPSPQDTPQSTRDPSLNSVPALVEHPVYSALYCGTRGTLPHAAEAPARSFSGLAQAAALLPGAPHQGRLVLPIGEDAQELKLSRKGR